MKDKSIKQEKQKRTHIFSGSTFEELAGYSRAVVVGDHIYVSGTVGINFQTGKLPEDAAGQAEKALDTIEKALHQAQSGLHDMVRVRVFLTSPNHVPGSQFRFEAKSRIHPTCQYHRLHCFGRSGMPCGNRG